VVASRLVALLPDTSRLAIPTPVAVFATTGAGPSRRFALAGVVVVVLICVVLYSGALHWR
jgi:hypothetical protein